MRMSCISHVRLCRRALPIHQHASALHICVSQDSIKVAVRSDRRLDWTCQQLGQIEANAAQKSEFVADCCMCADNHLHC